jgi:indole-3-glycerol phosphate synthase
MDFPAGTRSSDRRRPARVESSQTLTEQTPKVKAGSGFLSGVLAEKREEVAAARRARPLARLVAECRDRPPVRSLEAAVRLPGCGVVAEVKRASPSAGPLAPDLVARERALVYAARGAIAISVLTDRRFAGRIEDLLEVAGRMPVPVLRKDFLVDPWQIWESRAAGADAGLLIVAALLPDEIESLAAEAETAGLGLLFEIHAPEEAERALDLDETLVGVNARDLETLAVDVPGALSILGKLRSAAPEVALVAESGIASPAAVRDARSAGADAVLAGEHLARAADPGDTLERLVAAGRDGA